MSDDISPSYQKLSTSRCLLCKWDDSILTKRIEFSQVDRPVCRNRDFHEVPKQAVYCDY